MNTITSYADYDIKTLVGTSVIEGQLRLTYSDETAYLDALVAAAWKHVENFVGVSYGAGTLTFESNKIESKFTAAVDAERISATEIQYWDGSTYNTVATSYNSTVGYPAIIKVDADDPALTAAETDDAWAITKGTVTIDEIEPSASMQQAFLVYLAHLYQNREAVVTGTIATEMPLAFSSLLTPYKKGILR